MSTPDKYCVYILRCADNSYYTGVTNDLERRMFEHSNAFNPKSYTATRRPLVVVFEEYFYDIEQAISFEKQIKKWRRAKKEALIKRDWVVVETLKKLHAIWSSWFDKLTMTRSPVTMSPVEG